MQGRLSPSEPLTTTSGTPLDSASDVLSVKESVFTVDGSTARGGVTPEASLSCLLASVRRLKLRRASLARIEVV